MAASMTCPACRGTGRIIWRYGGVNAKCCPWCSGSGAADETQASHKLAFFMPTTKEEA
jgi:DnaJ-class molecular chaperone